MKKESLSKIIVKKYIKKNYMEGLNSRNKNINSGGYP